MSTRTFLMATAYKGPDYPNELPGAYVDVALVFSANDTIKYPLTDDNAWKSLLPDEVGMVRLGPKGRPFGVSMYHQLHCITHMRSSYVRARSGAISPQQVDMAVAHDIHCLQFLRHSILCHGDTTLISIESNSTSEELHRCRDWTAIRAYVEKNKSEWEGIPYPDALEDLL